MSLSAAKSPYAGHRFPAEVINQAGIVSLVGYKACVVTPQCDIQLHAAIWGSSALLVQSGGTLGDEATYGTGIYKGLIPFIVPSCSAADPGRSIGRAGSARARSRHHCHRAHAIPERPPPLWRPVRPGPQPPCCTDLRVGRSDPASAGVHAMRT